ncbi:uncharacterized protein K452DRAFT_282953 [Aplosporella prunicola CBS 121167]|uniref:Secreted protein n=1 Tax=Aplosporella prunicola CBS 121167 TaxID=1176127 RepID=A0A6A6BRP0_9PEZI|nr:uncharacterized protein K452DRAFT_282953 [Aplosporella prunicola CBS 121167]KAF2146759.1 hypothetical protein K452DRAFT_282953 [Aplosporella prunicola CBS 121167]
MLCCVVLCGVLCCSARAFSFLDIHPFPSATPHQLLFPFLPPTPPSIRFFSHSSIILAYPLCYFPFSPKHKKITP